MPAQRIVLLTGNPLSTNPRVIKEAAALTKEGYEVIVHGAWSGEGGGGGGVSVERCFGGNGGRQRADGGGMERDMRLAEQGGYTFVPLLPPNTPEGKLHRLVQRAARKFMPWSKWTFGLMPMVLEREAKRLKPDLAIAHSEPALFAALGLHWRGVRVGLDMEDWYSEDLPAGARKGRPVGLLRAAEKQLLGCAAHATCTTEAMADALALEYGCPRPERIYNVFPSPVLPQQLELRDRSSASKSLNGTSSRGRAVHSIHWFSQTIGPGRGLEDLFGAAENLPDEWEIHLRGAVGRYEEWLASVIPAPVRHKVFVHARVPAAELAERIAEHDIGFAGEVAPIRSRNLTATNKIFQYLQGGLAVVASDTVGQMEVAELAGSAVRTYRGGDCNDLRCALEEWLHSPEKLRAAKVIAGDIAVEQLNWDKEKGRFIVSVREALTNSRRAVARG